MKLCGTILLENNEKLTFYPNGDIIHYRKNQNHLVTIYEAIMFFENSPSFTHGSSTYQIEGKYVTYNAFVAHLKAVPKQGPAVADADYVEEANPDYSKHVNKDKKAIVHQQPTHIQLPVDEDSPAVVIGDDQSGEWWK